MNSNSDRKVAVITGASKGIGLAIATALAEAGYAAVVNLSKALAEEFGPKGIRVNSVSPGPVRTPLWVGPGGMADTFAQATGKSREEVVEQLPKLAGITLGRFLRPDEIASLVLFLMKLRRWCCSLRPTRPP